MGRAGGLQASGTEAPVSRAGAHVARQVGDWISGLRRVLTVHAGGSTGEEPREKFIGNSSGAVGHGGSAGVLVPPKRGVLTPSEAPSTAETPPDGARN